MATNDELHSGSPNRFIEALPLKLKRCPLCRYLLDGLPTRHRCPECGFDYDKRWDVIHQDRRIGSILLACVLFTWVMSFVNWVAFSSPGRLILGLGLVLWMLGCVGLCWRAISFLRGGRRNTTIVGHEGVQIFRSREPVRQIPWAAFDDVIYTRVGGAAGLRKNGRVLETIDQTIFGSNRKTVQFIAIANEWKQRAAGRDD